MNAGRRYPYRVFIFLVLGLVLLEFIARFIIGFGNPPLFEASSDYGYRFVPNQDIRRYGNRIFFNAQGLRSEPIDLEPQRGTMRILCIGDSITYGGALTDQKDTYPYKLQDVLNKKGTGCRFEVLNASAPSWSIEDEKSYIRKHGLYNSRVVVLQISQHDLFQTKSRREIVGKSPMYPDKKPVLALWELVVKSIYQIRSFLKFDESYQKNILPSDVQLENNINSLLEIANFVKNKGGEFIIVFVGTILKSGDKLSREESAKSRLFDVLEERDIKFITLDRKFSSEKSKMLFRDKIHPNQAGNGVIADAVAEFILHELGPVIQLDCAVEKPH